MSKRSNIEFMIAWLDALRRGDREAAATALHPAVVWQGMRPEWGCDGVPTVLSTFMDARDAPADIESIELIGAEQQVILHVRWPIVIDEDEKLELPDGVYNVFTIAGDLITRIEDHADRGAALAAAGLAG